MPLNDKREPVNWHRHVGTWVGQRRYPGTVSAQLAVEQHRHRAEAIKVVVRAHKTLIWERTRHTQRLRHALREYFPAALEAFEDLAVADALELLTIESAPGARPGLRLASQIRIGVRVLGNTIDNLVAAELAHSGEEFRLGDVSPVRFDGGKPAQQDEGRRLDPMYRCARFLKEIGVGGGINRWLPEAGCVRLIPYLPSDHASGRVPAGGRGREVRETLSIGGRTLVTVTTGCASPGRRVGENGKQGQSAAPHRVGDAVEAFPFVRAGRRRLDVAPRQIGTDDADAEGGGVVQRGSQCPVVPVRADRVHGGPS